MSNQSRDLLTVMLKISFSSIVLNACKLIHNSDNQRINMHSELERYCSEIVADSEYKKFSELDVMLRDYRDKVVAHFDYKDLLATKNVNAQVKVPYTERCKKIFIKTIEMLIESAIGKYEEGLITCSENNALLLLGDSELAQWVYAFRDMSNLESLLERIYPDYFIK